MKSYEKALEALKAIDFIDACDKAPASARNELKTVIKCLKAFSEGKTYQEYLEGLTDESNC